MSRCDGAASSSSSRPVFLVQRRVLFWLHKHASSYSPTEQPQEQRRGVGKHVTKSKLTNQLRNSGSTVFCCLRLFGQARERPPVSVPRSAPRPPRPQTPPPGLFSLRRWQHRSQERDTSARTASEGTRALEGPLQVQVHFVGARVQRRLETLRCGGVSMTAT